VPEIIIQHGTYQCAACGSMLQFEPCKITEVSSAIGFCAQGHDCYDPEHMASNCSMWRVRLKIPLKRLQCDLAPREMMEAEL
jgi:hypothetical protein